MPMGAALVGLPKGQSIDWKANDGRLHKLTVLRVVPPDAGSAVTLGTETTISCRKPRASIGCNPDDRKVTVPAPAQPGRRGRTDYFCGSVILWPCPMCGRRAPRPAAEAEMIDRSKELAEEARRISDTERIRSCLICRKDFSSAWAGERICRNCKSTSTWRSGIA